MPPNLMVDVVHCRVPMPFVVVLLVLTGLKAACGQLPDNTVVTAPTLDGTAVPEEALQAAAAPALESMQLANSIMASVEHDKAAVKQALANPTTAFAKYMADWESGVVSSASVSLPGSASDSRTLKQREHIFTANLRVSALCSLHVWLTEAQRCML
jgi:hypothetical protein